jgi:hypothetical protein
MLAGLIIHDVYPGFREDYLVLQCLLRTYEPKTVFEVGTNTANGVRCIAAAVPEAKIFSLDLDYETMMHNSKQYPIGEQGEDRVGSDAKHIKYTQLRGDSLTFDYYKYPAEAYYCDGEHSYDHVYHETKAIIALNPIIIVYHDADMPEVFNGIIDSLNSNDVGNKYYIYRVVDTRILYILRQDYADMEANKRL